jgi:arylsulfatase A-like enzyme
VPGLTKGDSTTSLTELVDIYPSLCELIGLPVPEHVQDTSFVPVLSNPDAEPKKYAFSLYPRYKDEDRRDKTIGYSVRTDRYRYNEWVHIPSGTIVARELYDYKADPRETVNAVDTAACADVVEELCGVLNTHRKKFAGLK